MLNWFSVRGGDTISWDNYEGYCSFYAALLDLIGKSFILQSIVPMLLGIGNFLYRVPTIMWGFHVSRSEFVNFTHEPEVLP